MKPLQRYSDIARIAVDNRCILIDIAATWQELLATGPFRRNQFTASRDIVTARGNAPTRRPCSSLIHPIS